MAIEVDQSRALRRPLDIAALVAAVERAHPADEGGWIEWKCGLDLRRAEGAFKTAKAILSFANRMPDVAERTCGGLAYLLLGVEPGNVPGTEAIDGADLEQALARYLGPDGPDWSPQYVEHHDAVVLVIIVEAPSWGDEIFTLRKAFEGFVDGTVFFRTQSSSRPATSGELRLLQQRLLRGREADPQLSGLEVTAAVEEPDQVVVVDPSPEGIERWLGERRDAITEWQTEQVAAAGKEKGFVLRPAVDTAAIEAHLDDCRDVLFDAQCKQIFAAGWSKVTVSVRNPTPRVLADVELTLHLDELVDSGWSAWDPTSTRDIELDGLPQVPPVRSPMASFLNMGRPTSSYPFVTNLVPEPIYESHDLDIAEAAITLSLGQLRPEKRVSAPPFSLVLHTWSGAGYLTVPWSATSTSTSGILRGELQLPLTRLERVALAPSRGIPKDD